MTAESSSQSYRADIDGLRTIAVGSVILYHFGLTTIPGGFVGVDIFFVISGFLISGILAKDISSKGLSLVTFYNRRIRRIFPAVVVLLIVCLIGGWFLLPPSDYAAVGESSAYSAFGAGNLYFYWNTGYFDRAAELLPLLHLWSLGVEEQFYLAWPLLLALFMWVARGRAWITASLIILLIAASFIASLFVLPADPKAAFFLPHVRAWELAIGALLVFTPAIKSRVLAELMGLAGIALIAYSLIFLKAGDAFPGLNAVPSVIGAALLVWPRARTTTSFLLSTPPMVLTGKISYSLYLWHWPVLVFFRHYSNGQQPTWVESSVLIAVVYLVSLASWKFVEQPFRRDIAKPVRTIGIGLLASSVVAVAGAASLVRSGFPERISKEALALSDLDLMWEWPCPSTAQIDGGFYCGFGAPWTTATTRGIVWGDSHAEHISPVLASIAEAHDAAFIVYRGCAPIVDGKSVSQIYPDQPNYTEGCRETHEKGMQLLRNHPEINLVVLAASWGHNMGRFHRPGTQPPEMGRYGVGTDILAFGIETFMTEAAAPRRKFAVIADVPQWVSDPTPCAIREMSSLARKPCAPTDLILPLGRFESLQGPEYRTLRKMSSDHPDLRVVFPADGMCHENGCISDIDGVFLYREESHIRRNLPTETLKKLADMIQLQNLFGDAPLASSHQQKDSTAAPPVLLPEIDTSRATARRMNDLVRINAALDAYRRRYGSYPPSYSGLQGVIELGEDWIPGLAPEFLPSIPRDPVLSDSKDGPQYLYVSDTKNYKLIAHGVGGVCGPNVEKDGVRVDKARSNANGCWAYGFWTPGFEKF